MRLPIVIATFDDFLRFFFDGGVELFKREDWDDEPELRVDPTNAVSYYRRLFGDIDSVTNRYDREQMRVGFAAMINCNVPLYVADLIWDQAVAITDREALVSSMASLYSGLFGEDTLFGVGFMWWDIITYDFECGIRHREDSEEVARLQDRMFKTLEEILASSSVKSQEAALHGLAHLHHPQTAEVIHAYVQRHPTISRELREFAMQCALGLVQ